MQHIFPKFNFAFGAVLNAVKGLFDVFSFFFLCKCMALHIVVYKIGFLPGFVFFLLSFRNSVVESELLISIVYNQTH